MAVTLTNTTDRHLAASLYHGIYCVGGGPCRCLQREVRRPVRLADGTTRSEFEQQRIPVTIDLPPGGSLAGLHPAVMKVPQIKAAVDEGMLGVKIVAEAAPPRREVIEESKSRRGRRR